MPDPGVPGPEDGPVPGPRDGPVPGPGAGPRDGGPGAGVDPEVIDLATKIFNLARAGDTVAIAGYVADPTTGQPSAADTAAMFGNEEFLAWFAERSGGE